LSLLPLSIFQSKVFCNSAVVVVQYGRAVTSGATIYAFFFDGSFAFAAFFLLLRIITTLRNDPTRADASNMRITGMRIAQTRGGKSCWMG
jgi:hypothetical protein